MNTAITDRATINTIATLRHLTTAIWGENSIQIHEKYNRTKAGKSEYKVYSLNGVDFMPIRELCDKLRAVCKATKRDFIDQR